MTKDHLSRLVRAGLLTGVVDGIFSSVLSVAFYGSTVSRLFQGVAATLLGAKAFDGGNRSTLIGVLIRRARLQPCRESPLKRRPTAAETGSQP